MSVPDGLMVNLWESLKKGEIVLIERADSGDQYFGLHQLVSWGKGRGYSVMVVDVLDSLHLLRAKARLAGLDDSVFDDIPVIKIGGSIEAGKVIGWIKDPSEPAILSRKFKEAYEEFLESNSPVLTVTVGLEKLFVAAEFSSKNVQAIIGSISRYVGDERRLAVILLKARVIDPSRQAVVRLLEDIATTVIAVSRRDKITEFHVIKSVNHRLEGMTIRI
ncbi:hypothetical protein E3E36_05320 [Thermococcus sp. M36]|uniref:DUF257 family protein n=1 Tax=Thermococcus sp. M36 TaxID=1638261 RepID=UPI00143C2017|nr:DUF257 family protein [Thermococcus sp. M36]NJE05571.1 hypothetical protein [Thermococcus sp. M36]